MLTNASKARRSVPLMAVVLMLWAYTSYFSVSCNSCVDTDECTSSKHDCSSDGDCVNVVGSYQCFCESGFTGDGKICQGNIYFI